MSLFKRMFKGGPPPRPLPPSPQSDDDEDDLPPPPPTAVQQFCHSCGAVVKRFGPHSCVFCGAALNSIPLRQLEAQGRRRRIVDVDEADEDGDEETDDDEEEEDNAPTFKEFLAKRPYITSGADNPFEYEESMRRLYDRMYGDAIPRPPSTISSQRE